MSTVVNWHFNKARLDEALMDLIKDPLNWGTEDPGAPGVFHRELGIVIGARIGILYAIPDPEDREVAVVDIRTSS